VPERALPDIKAAEDAVFQLLTAEVIRYLTPEWGGRPHMERDSRGRVAHYLFVTVLLCAAAASFFVFTGETRTRILEQNQQYAYDAAIHAAGRVEDMREARTAALDLMLLTVAETVAESWLDQDHLSLLQESSIFDYVEFIDTNGWNYNADGTTFDVSGRKNFLCGIRGETGSHVIFDSRLAHETLVSFYTPVRYHDEIIGVLNGMCREERLWQAISGKILGADTKSFLCMEDGTVISSYGCSSSVKNLLDSMARHGGTSEATLSEVRSTFTERGTLSYTARSSSGASSVSVVPVGADWMLVQTVPSAVTEQMAAGANRIGMKQALCLAALCLIYAVYLAITNLYERRRLTSERQDMTALRRQMDAMQQALRDAFRAAEDGSRAKSDFLSRMSHDMRTPMNAVLGMTAIALSHPEDGSRVRDCLEEIDASGRRLLDLINEVLDMSKIESGGLALDEAGFDLAVELDKVLEKARSAAAKKEIRLDAAVTPMDHTAVLGDAVRLGQVLWNLLDNAVKYTPPGGTVTFRARELSCHTPKSGQYEFTVEDTGIGIDPQLLPKIFEPFTRGKSGGAGTGLGLSVAQAVVKLMNGGIKAESEPGRGSKFAVHLFLKVEESLPSSGAAPPKGGLAEAESRPIMRHAGIRVLLAEDIEINRVIVREILKKAGLLVETAENGAEAVELVRKQPPAYYDLVFMDLQMPVMDGYQASRAIRDSGREDLRQIPIVAVSANAFHEDVLRAKDAGMNDLVMKPVDLDRLLAALDQWLPERSRESALE